MWLSPFRIGEHDERLLAGLSDVDPGRPELDHPLDLRGLVRRPQVEVVAVLALVPSGCRSISYPRTSDQNSAIRPTSCTSNVHCAIRLVTADTPPLRRCGRRTR